MYSTNLTIHQGTTLFSGDECVGTSYGWESTTTPSPPTQTAKDNALLWSLAPAMADLLMDAYLNDKNLDARWFTYVRELFEKIGTAFPPASVAADG